MMLVCWQDIKKLGTLKLKGECIAAIADGVALKAIAFALVQDPDLEAQAALETDCLFIDINKLSRQPHAACLLVQFVKKCLNLPQQICLLTLLLIVTEVWQGEALPEVFPAMLPTDLVTLTHMLVHRTCVLVVASCPCTSNQYSNWGFEVRLFAKSRPTNFYNSGRLNRTKSMYIPDPAPSATARQPVAWTNQPI
jgi:hypothetical protein